MKEHLGKYLACPDMQTEPGQSSCPHSASEICLWSTSSCICILMANSEGEKTEQLQAWLFSFNNLCSALGFLTSMVVGGVYIFQSEIILKILLCMQAIKIKVNFPFTLP